MAARVVAVMDKRRRSSVSTDASRTRSKRSTQSTSSMGSTLSVHELVDGMVVVKTPLRSVWDRMSARFWALKGPASAIYADIRVQVLVAVLIAGNFLVNIIEKQVWPTGKVCDLRSHECMKDTKCRCRKTTMQYKRIFRTTDLIFNILFSVELSWNMYANWLHEFWGSGWNVFDFITVLVSWLMKVFPNLPGPLKMLRMVRALRVFRLFKRVKSLRKILEAIARAVPGVVNAFIIMLIVMCIYAILAVDFFANEGKNGVFHFESGFTKTDVNRDLLGLVDNTTISNARFYIDNFDGTGFSGDLPSSYVQGYVDNLKTNVAGSGTYYTPRHSDWGHEYFGNFGKSLFTLFQVLTGDSWAEAIGRPLLQGWNPLGTAMFFVSFILLHSVVLINVVVAVLLEKMVTPEDEEDDWDDDDENELTDRLPDLLGASPPPPTGGGGHGSSKKVPSSSSSTAEEETTTAEEDPAAAAAAAAAEPIETIEIEPWGKHPSPPRSMSERPMKMYEMEPYQIPASVSASTRKKDQKKDPRRESKAQTNSGRRQSTTDTGKPPGPHHKDLLTAIRRDLDETKAAVAHMRDDVRALTDGQTKLLNLLNDLYARSSTPAGS